MTLSVEEAWDKGCTDIMYMIIEYPNYPIISLLHNQGKIMWTCCDWEIQVSTSGLELEFSQLNVLTLSDDARLLYSNIT